ncbi:UNVERIFIED_ORG: hypothetical protein [Escherichia phage CMSTMSU]
MAAGGASGFTNQGNSADPFSTNGRLDVIPVGAEHVIHLTLNTGQDGVWPFGTSILEDVFKVYKQKNYLKIVLLSIVFNVLQSVVYLKLTLVICKLTKQWHT